MDDIVRKALEKWPDVPHAYGWLSLDPRGNWLLKGERIGNAGVIAFINRNYESDARGRWYFQNGPQRVYVALPGAPHVYRLETQDGNTLATHTGHDAGRVDGAWLDDRDRVVILADAGVGTLDDRDLPRIVPWLSDEHGKPVTDDDLARWMAGDAAVPPPWLRLAGCAVPVERIAAADLPHRFAFDPDPRPADGEPEC